MTDVLSCRLIGHRMRFSSEGATMRWRCERGCGAGGEKTYASAADAARYARAFDREDSEDIGRRAPLIGMFPLRIAPRDARAQRTPQVGALGNRAPGLARDPRVGRARDRLRLRGMDPPRHLRPGLPAEDVDHGGRLAGDRAVSRPAGGVGVRALGPAEDRALAGRTGRAARDVVARRRRRRCVPLRRRLHARRHHRRLARLRARRSSYSAWRCRPSTSPTSRSPSRSASSSSTSRSRRCGASGSAQGPSPR